MAANSNEGERKDPPPPGARRGDDDDDNNRISSTHRRPSAEPTSSEGCEESLDSIARWILSIPPAHVTVLQHMREYRDLLQAFRGLQREHEKLLAWRRRRGNNNCLLMSSDDNNNDNDLTELTVVAMMMTSSSSSSFSFLQFMASDELVLKILDFLEAVSLCQVMQTCSRFRDLVLRNAQRRTKSIGRERQLPNVLQLLRAKEHIQGITGMSVVGGNNNNGAGGAGPFVRVPTLLLSRCVQVTNAGDEEYNGIYCCTGSNGNGFVFTKPREPFQRIRRRRRRNSIAASAQQSTGDPDTDVIADATQQQHSNNDDNETDNNDDDDDEDSYYLLRCIIAKRFSNETLLWYFSKEVVANTEDHQPGEQIRAGHVTQRYSFWARLSQLGDATPDQCRYPSQTSILRRNGEGWQPLTTTRDTTPPTVELIN